MPPRPLPPSPFLDALKISLAASFRQTRIDELLSELGSYWRLDVGSTDFLDRLCDVWNRFPRIHDVIELRVVRQIREMEAPPDPDPYTSVDLRLWLKVLGSRIAKKSMSSAVTPAPEACANSDIDASPQFDLLLFDLDDTLVQSGHLDHLRGQANIRNQSKDYIDAVSGAASSLLKLVEERLLLDVQESFPTIRLGVFTRSPRAYAVKILTRCYPQLYWDTIVAYEDVERVKPCPEGVQLAARVAGIKDIGRVAVIGDSASDIEAAYAAGAFAVLFRGAWGQNWNSDRNEVARRDHYHAEDRIADAIIDTPEALPRLITSPWSTLPILEYFDYAAGAVATTLQQTTARVDHCHLFAPDVDRATEKNWVKVSVLGRYFPLRHSRSRYDFHARGTRHSLSRTILAAKDGEDYPESWIQCCARMVNDRLRSACTAGSDFVVTAIPARMGRPPRMERLIERVAKYVSDQTCCRLTASVLRFRAGANSNKALTQIERYANIRDHLYVEDARSIRGAHVLLFDDVATSGATFFYADRYLRDAGASNVECIALAKTIS